jgi:hypothetical protein
MCVRMKSMATSGCCVLDGRSKQIRGRGTSSVCSQKKVMSQMMWKDLGCKLTNSRSAWVSPLGIVNGNIFVLSLAIMEPSRQPLDSALDPAGSRMMMCHNGYSMFSECGP